MDRRVAAVSIAILNLLLCSAWVESAEDFEFLFAASRLNDGSSLRDPMGLAVSRESGDILIADTGNDRVCILNSDGILIKTIGRVAGVGSPIGATYAENDEIYITETVSPRIKRFDFNGRSLPSALVEPIEGGFIMPGRIATDDKGGIYVADRASPRALIVAASGGETRQIRQAPEPDEPEWKVQDVAVDNAGNIYVLSSQGLAVHMFNASGHYLRSFGKHGADEDRFSFPTGMAIGPDGNLWIVDSFRHEIKVFTTEGKFLFRWGRAGMSNGELFYPIDIAFGRGILYVLEKGMSRLQAFALHRESRK